MANPYFKMKSIKIKTPSFVNSFHFENKPIGDVLKLYETLTGNTTRKIGSTTFGLCPFHSERTPSMALYPVTNSFYCWGCEAGGDAIALVMKVNECTYPEAVDYIKHHG